MWTCENCGTEVDNDKLITCFNCGHGKDGATPVDPETLAEAKAIKATPGLAGKPPRQRSERSSDASGYASSYASALRVCGWVALVAGIIGFLLVLRSIPERPLDGRAPSAAPQYLAVALAVAFQGAFAFVLCRVIAEIAEDVKLIRQETFRRR